MKTQGKEGGRERMWIEFEPYTTTVVLYFFGAGKREGIQPCAEKGW